MDVQYLVDTNILLRWTVVADPLYSIVRDCMDRLDAGDIGVCITPQNIVEFWNVATRPVVNNGLGMSHAETDSAIRRIEGTFVMLPDTPTIYSVWRRLVLECHVSGRQVHDARLASVALAYGIQHLVTLNEVDFRRYPGIRAIHPADAQVS